MGKLKVIDLFSGIGGLSSGFYLNNNFKILAANEILSDMAKTYSLNHPDVLMYNKDIKNFSAIDFYKDTDYKYKNIDIIIGGPPCQSFSTVGNRLLDDPRGKLFQEYYRLLKEFKPNFFLFENVTGILSMRNGLYDYIIKLFESLSYKVSSKILNAADYGVPQNRKRVFIVGTKLNVDFSYPNPIYSNSSSSNLFKYRTLSDAISDLPLIKSGEESFKYKTSPQNSFQKMMRNGINILDDHNASNHGKNLINIMDSLPDGGTMKDLPLHLKPKSGFCNTYSKLWWSKPCTTITRNFGTPSSSRCIHPKVSRALTTREGARIQTFPDSFKFVGSRSSKNLQIGNAVPPLLSKILAESIYNHFILAE